MTQFFFQIALIVVSIAGAGLVISPLYTQIEVTQSEMEGYDVALNSAMETNDLLVKLRREIDTFNQADKFRIELLVPEELAPVRAAYDLEAIVENSGLLLESITIGEVDRVSVPVQAPAALAAVPSVASDNVFADVAEITTANDLFSQKIDVKASGSYEQFKRLLASLETSARLIDIDSFSFTDEGTDLVTYTLSVSVYGYSAEVSAG